MDQPPILRYFESGHLPDALAEVSRPFQIMAEGIVANLPDGPERTVALRKLLESKDAAVRAALGRPMRHLTAVQLDEGWQYASLSSRGGHPLGYCAEPHHHVTETDARLCYARWQRDQLDLDGHLVHWSDCRVCGAATKTYASIRGHDAIAPLCGQHLTAADAVSVLGLDLPAGDAWIS